MATTTKTKPAPKQEEKGRQPDFIIRCKQAPKPNAKDGDKVYYSTIGAAWQGQTNDGEVIYSLKINNIPMNWDGSAIMLPPLPDRE